MFLSSRQPPLTGGISATSAPARISVSSVAYSESTAIITLGGQRGELGVLHGEGQAKVGDGRRQGQIDLDLGLGPPAPWRRRRGGCVSTDAEPSLPAVEVVRRVQVVGQLRMGDLDLDDRGSGCAVDQGVDALVPGEVGICLARSQGRMIGWACCPPRGG